MTTAIDKLLADGFVAVRRAVAPGVVRTCVALIEDELAPTVGAVLVLRRGRSGRTGILVGSHPDVPRVAVERAILRGLERRDS